MGKHAMRPAGQSRRLWRNPVGVVLAASLLVLLVMYFTNSNVDNNPDAPRGDGVYRPLMARGDGHMLYLISRSLVLDRDLVFDNDLQRFGDPWRQPRTVTGRKNIPHPIGPALVWAPWLALAHGASKIANMLGADVAAHGYTMWHQRVVFVTSVIFAFAAVVIGYLLARRLLERRPACANAARPGGGLRGGDVAAEGKPAGAPGSRWPPLYAAVAVLFGTSLTYYATYMPSYGHAADAAACAGFLGYWAVTWGDRCWRRFVILGALLGIAALIRSQEIVLGVVVAFEVAVLALGPAAHGEPRARWMVGYTARGLVALVMALAVFSPQMIAWKLLYDAYLASPMGPGFMRLGHPEVLELLFSSRNGWLSTTPIAYAGVVGLLFVPRRVRLIAVGFGLALVLQVWINAAVYDWWAGASFGQRRLCSMTVVVVVGLAALLQACAGPARRLPRLVRHGLALAILGWFVAWNLAQVHALRRAKAAGRPVSASCCAQVRGPLARLAQPVYDRIGNPFSLPASGYFALRYGVDIHRWDRVAGDYVYVPPWNKVLDGSFRKDWATWDIVAAGKQRFIAGGLGPAQRDPRSGRTFRWTTAPRAEVFVPIHVPQGHRFTLAVAAGAEFPDALAVVRISWNGRVVLEHAAQAQWATMRFEVPASRIAVGTNVLAVAAELRPYAGGTTSLPPPPSGAQAVGVAVGQLRVGFLPSSDSRAPTTRPGQPGAR